MHMSEEKNFESDDLCAKMKNYYELSISNTIDTQ